ncbi:MAG TPA: aminotransferase class V-fold PLP-dependent enzyme [Solirubrobacteraceae bacterium]|nr:aminotransferase class V-fold PLP-dependent enzyme [Solirubrobacteraceae bacterium]
MGGSSVRPPASRGALISLAVERVHPHHAAEILGRAGVCVLAGHHCSCAWTAPLLDLLGIERSPPRA